MFPCLIEPDLLRSLPDLLRHHPLDAPDFALQDGAPILVEEGLDKSSFPILEEPDIYPAAAAAGDLPPPDFAALAASVGVTPADESSDGNPVPVINMTFPYSLKFSALAS